MFFEKINKSVFLLTLFIFLIPSEFWETLIKSFLNINFKLYFQTTPIFILFKKFNYLNVIDSSLQTNFSLIKDIYPKFPVHNIKFNEIYSKSIFKNSYNFLHEYSKTEARKVYIKALELISRNATSKGRRLIIHAMKLDPGNPDILSKYGEIIEVQDKNLILAEYYCTKAVIKSPSHKKAEECRKRNSPIVEELDQKKLNVIDGKVFQFFKIPDNHPKLKELKKDQYFSYIFHTNAIEGNTLSLYQTRTILETRLAIGGKSLIEQNEVLGIDMALKFINTLLSRDYKTISPDDILEIHRRVLGFVDISEAGHFRKKQVFIADHIPPDSSLIPELMKDFIDWLNNQEEVHPIELAALAHWKLVYIHPFQDGNGRTARLLMNLILMQANYPPSIIRLENRELYFKLIKLADEGDVRPFIRFIADCTERTIDEYLVTKHPQYIESFSNVDVTNMTTLYSQYQ